MIGATGQGNWQGGHGLVQGGVMVAWANEVLVEMKCMLEGHTGKHIEMLRINCAMAASSGSSW